MGVSLAAGLLRLAICWHVCSCRAHTGGNTHTLTMTQLAFGERALHCTRKPKPFAICARSTQIPKSGKLGAKVSKYYCTHSACVLSIAIGRIVCCFASVKRVLAS